jgi:hypothetical protein
MKTRLLRINPFICIQSFEIVYIHTWKHAHTHTLSLSLSTFLSEYVSLFSHVHFRVNLYLVPDNFAQPLFLLILLWESYSVKTSPHKHNCGCSADLRTEWAHHTINFTYESQQLGAAETGSEHWQQILLPSLYIMFVSLPLLSHHRNMTSWTSTQWLGRRVWILNIESEAKEENSIMKQTRWQGRTSSIWTLPRNVQQRLTKGPVM